MKDSKEKPEARSAISGTMVMQCFLSSEFEDVYLYLGKFSPYFGCLPMEIPVKIWGTLF